MIWGDNITQAGLELTILPPPPLKLRGFSLVPPQPA